MEVGIALDQKVYNAVVHALAKGYCVEDTNILVWTMDKKKVAPDTATSNSPSHWSSLQGWSCSGGNGNV